MLINLHKLLNALITIYMLQLYTMLIDEVYGI